MNQAQVLCIGESMAVLVPDPDRADRWISGFGGAESNVAITLARLGVRSRWFSAVGADRFGRLLLAELADHGVDVSEVVVDAQRPTGLYVKEIDDEATTVRYYRRGSAASALSAADLSTVDLGTGWVHLSGITPALSSTCAELVERLLATPRSQHVSFDVNYRPTLCPAQDPALLLDLARRADLVFLGEDEASSLWGTESVADVLALLPTPSVVVKSGAQGATVDGVHAPGLRVDVVEPVGAGDAFAAGFLAAHLQGRSALEKLRSGHIAAASALRTVTDIGEPVTEQERRRLLASSAQEWSAATVGASQVVFG